MIKAQALLSILNCRPKSFDFKVALWSALASSSNGPAFARWGLAISGGVDSMALAFFFRKYLETEHLEQNCYKAFVVDHRARVGSTEEAQSVADRLGKLLGSAPEILTLDWPEGLDPSQLGNFESQARRKRYRVLGKACHAEGVSHLLVAHHADDMAETLLARLSEGHGTRGLGGLSQCSQIPECEGMHGVYESGALKYETPRSFSPSYTERGGVSIVRPLLSVPKRTLIATCKDAGLDWAEDNTNHDPTFTKRNAIRSLLVSRRLPVALSVESLEALRLSSQRSAEQRSKLAKILFRACWIRNFDLRSGLLVITIPTFEHVFGLSQAFKDNGEKYAVAAEFMRLVLDMVTPKETVDVRNFGSLITRIFPKQFAPTQERRRLIIPEERRLEEKRGIAAKWDKITYGGVLIEKLVPGIGDTGYHLECDEDSGITTWQLSRQPYTRGVYPSAMFLPVGDRSPWPEYANFARVTDENPFALWDGRYWLRVKHKLPHPLFVVPLLVNPRNILYHALDSEGDGLLKKRLVQCTTPDNRWILPAIAGAVRGLEGQRAGDVLAVPTLGIVKDGWDKLITWDIRYKKIDCTGLVPRRDHAYSLKRQALEMDPPT